MTGPVVNDTVVSGPVVSGPVVSDTAAHTPTQAPADLSKNETPYPPLPAIQRLLREGAGALHRYPDFGAGELTAGLADMIGVGPDAILVGPGSAALCQHLLQALGPEPEVVYPALTFEGYPLLIRNTGARGVAVPMDGYRPDLAAMAAAVTSSTRCVLLCNPNNPTGAVLHHDELADFLSRVPPDLPVIIDEAYREFVTDPDAADGLRLYRASGSVCVLRTFSKAYALAGLRVGYAVVPPRLAPAARLLGVVFFPGSLAQAAALASLQPAVHARLRRRWAALCAARDELITALRGMGLPVAPSQGNFVWLPLGTLATQFAEHVAAAGIRVWTVDGEGVRITIGSAPARRRLLALCAAWQHR